MDRVLQASTLCNYWSHPWLNRTDWVWSRQAHDCCTPRNMVEGLNILYNLRRLWYSAPDCCRVLLDCSRQQSLLETYWLFLLAKLFRGRLLSVATAQHQSRVLYQASWATLQSRRYRLPVSLPCPHHRGVALQLTLTFDTRQTGATSVV